MCTKIDMYNTGKLLNKHGLSDEELECLLLRLEQFRAFCDGVGSDWALVSRDINRHVTHLVSMKKARSDLAIRKINVDHGIQDC